MMRMATALLLGLCASLPALAAECDMDEALAKIQKSEANQITYGIGMINDIPSIAVDEQVWANAPYNTRLGLAKTFECAVVGKGSVLSEAQIVNRGGEVLAVWDGLHQELDFK